MPSKSSLQQTKGKSIPGTLTLGMPGLRCIEVELRASPFKTSALPIGYLHPLSVTPGRAHSWIPAIQRPLFSHVELIAAPQIVLSVSLHFVATIRPPDVTCIPKVRSIQMLIHPTFTPILSEDGHQLTLEEVFRDLFYRLELRVNHTYQMVNAGHAPCLRRNPLPLQEYWTDFSKSGALHERALSWEAPRFLVGS